LRNRGRKFGSETCSEFFHNFQPPTKRPYHRGCYLSKAKQSYPRNRPWTPIEVYDVEDATLSRQSAHRSRQDCQSYGPAALYSPETLFFRFWYSFLLEAERTPGPSAAGRIRKREKIHVIGSRTPPACSTITLPRAPFPN
jgi:hypothetical protein